MKNMLLFRALPHSLVWTRPKNQNESLAEELGCLWPKAQQGKDLCWQQGICFCWVMINIKNTKGLCLAVGNDVRVQSWINMYRINWHLFDFLFINLQQCFKSLNVMWHEDFLKPHILCWSSLQVHDSYIICTNSCNYNFLSEYTYLYAFRALTVVFSALYIFTIVPSWAKK